MCSAAETSLVMAGHLGQRQQPISTWPRAVTMHAGPESLGSHALSFSRSIRRGSLRCQLWFRRQLWVSKEIKHFVEIAELRPFPPAEAWFRALYYCLRLHFQPLWCVWTSHIPSARIHTVYVNVQPTRALPFTWNIFATWMNNPSKPREVSICLFNAVLPPGSPALCIKQ